MLKDTIAVDHKICLMGFEPATSGFHTWIYKNYSTEYISNMIPLKFNKATSNLNYKGGTEVFLRWHLGVCLMLHRSGIDAFTKQLHVWILGLRFVRTGIIKPGFYAPL